MARQPRRLVVCFDGTWNSADSAKTETNVAILARTVRPETDDGVLQLTTYLRGVGTSGLLLERLEAGATGEGLDENIRSGYMFLAQNYLPGDAIYVFGFSRGAFTARSLVGFIGSCGLLERSYLCHVHEAWTYYREVELRTPADFCARYNVQSQQSVEIDFLGVWDTVGALGVPGGLLNEANARAFQFHDTSPSKIMKVGRHALAIDERRGAFVPTLWTGDAPATTDIKQVWFAGVHSDVGGGYQNRLLAEIPLRWMAEEAVAAGLALDLDLLTSLADLSATAPQHDSRHGLLALGRPTLRQIAGATPARHFLEELYFPKDVSGAALPTINESIHVSARDRMGAQIVALDGDDDPTGTTQRYQPANVTAAIAKAAGQG